MNYQNLREWYVYIVGGVREVPGLIRPMLGTAFVAIMQPYADASEGKRLCWKICLLNTAIWLAWKLRRLERPMTVRFMHHPLSGLSFTLLTSMFRYCRRFYAYEVDLTRTYWIYSHKSFIHLAFNCLALESFGQSPMPRSCHCPTLYCTSRFCRILLHPPGTR